MKISYTREAIIDLERLRKFIEPKNPYAARRISSELLDGIGNLRAFPKMGLPVALASDPDSIRDLFCRSIHCTIFDWYKPRGHFKNLAWQGN